MTLWIVARCQAPLSMGFSRSKYWSCHFLLQIFLTQGLNLGLLYFRQILYHLSHGEVHFCATHCKPNLTSLSISYKSFLPSYLCYDLLGFITLYIQNILFHFSLLSPCLPPSLPPFLFTYYHMGFNNRGDGV